jgi:hypothetical protein
MLSQKNQVLDTCSLLQVSTLQPLANISIASTRPPAQRDVFKNKKDF